MSSTPPHPVGRVNLEHNGVETAGLIGIGQGRDMRIPSQTTASSPDRYHHHHLHPHHLHLPSHLHGIRPPPTTANAVPSGHFRCPADEANVVSANGSLPWTLGTTDGTYAAFALMQASAAIAPNSGISTSSSSGVVRDAMIGTEGETTNNLTLLSALNSQKSLSEEKIFHQPSSSVEAVLSAGCDVMNFDIAEVWLRTGPKTHQLTNSHLRPTALEDSIRNDLVDVYYGEKSCERTHRLSPALCKRAKEASDVVWVTEHTPHGAEALRCSISNVRTAVAIPVCHHTSNTNFTVIFFSVRRIVMKTPAVEFLMHISIAAAVASTNSLEEEGLIDRESSAWKEGSNEGGAVIPSSFSEHLMHNNVIPDQLVSKISVTGAQLDLRWQQLQNVEYLTDGGNSWIHTAVFNGKSVVVKTLKPECQDVAMAINEIEGELDIHSRLNHSNIVSLVGAGTTMKGVRFVVLERLDGGTLTQMLGYDTRIRDRRKRFWRKKKISYEDVLRCARSLADAMAYCHESAVPGCMVLHRDLKPDNIGFTLDGDLKIMDFGLARTIENASVHSTEVYAMSGETGSLRYMAPEVADALPYNHKVDVYSFGIILWELIAGKKPFYGLNREMFYERVVHDGERPPMNKKWPIDFTTLLRDCWSANMENRPTFSSIVERIDSLLENVKGERSGGNVKKSKINLRRISGIIDRHSTWF